MKNNKRQNETIAQVIRQAVAMWQKATSKEEKETAYERLVRDTDMMHGLEHHAYRLYEFYGKEELDWKGITYDDLMQWVHLGVMDALDRCKLEEDWGDARVVKTFSAFINMSAPNFAKHQIETAHGYSRHYCALLLRMKKRGLDLYGSSDESLCEAISSVEKGKCKNPMKVLRLMRTMFTDTVCLETVKGSTDDVYKAKEGTTEMFMSGCDIEPSWSLNGLYHIKSVLKDAARIDSEARQAAYALFLGAKEPNKTTVKRYAKMAGVDAEEAMAYIKNIRNHLKEEKNK